MVNHLAYFFIFLVLGVINARSKKDNWCSEHILAEKELILLKLNSLLNKI